MIRVLISFSYANDNLLFLRQYSRTVTVHACKAISIHLFGFSAWGPEPQNHLAIAYKPTDSACPTGKIDKVKNPPLIFLISVFIFCQETS